MSLGPLKKGRKFVSLTSPANACRKQRDPIGLRSRMRSRPEPLRVSLIQGPLVWIDAPHSTSDTVCGPEVNPHPLALALPQALTTVHLSCPPSIRKRISASGRPRFTFATTLGPQALSAHNTESFSRPVQSPPEVSPSRRQKRTALPEGVMNHIGVSGKRRQQHTAEAAAQRESND